MISLLNKTIRKTRSIISRTGVRELVAKEYFGQYGEDACLQTHFMCKAWNEHKDAEKIDADLVKAKTVARHGQLCFQVVSASSVQNWTVEFLTN